MPSRPGEGDSEVRSSCDRARLIPERKLGRAERLAARLRDLRIDPDLPEMVDDPTHP